MKISGLWTRLQFNKTICLDCRFSRIRDLREELTRVMETHDPRQLLRALGITERMITGRAITRDDVIFKPALIEGRITVDDIDEQSSFLVSTMPINKHYASIFRYEFLKYIYKKERVDTQLIAYEDQLKERTFTFLEKCRGVLFTKSPLVKGAFIMPFGNAGLLRIRRLESDVKCDFGFFGNQVESRDKVTSLGIEEREKEDLNSQNLANALINSNYSAALFQLAQIDEALSGNPIEYYTNNERLKKLLTQINAFSDELYVTNPDRATLDFHLGDNASILKIKFAAQHTPEILPSIKERTYVIRLSFELQTRDENIRGKFNELRTESLSDFLILKAGKLVFPLSYVSS